MSATAVGELLAALVVIITLARVFGVLARRCGQPDDALIVARQDGSHAGAHLVVRAGPGYVPATGDTQFTYSRA